MFRILSLLLIALSASPVLAEDGHAAEITWYSYEDGLARAAETGRPVVIDFHADWCKWCVELDKTTFRDARVVEAMNSRFVPVSVDTEKDQKTAALFAVRSLPTMWFLTSEGERIDALPGFVNADVFTIVLDYIATESYKTMEFQAFMDSRS